MASYTRAGGVSAARSWEILSLILWHQVDDSVDNGRLGAPRLEPGREDFKGVVRVRGIVGNVPRVADPVRYRDHHAPIGRFLLEPRTDRAEHFGGNPAESNVADHQDAQSRSCRIAILVFSREPGPALVDPLPAGAAEVLFVSVDPGGGLHPRNAHAHDVEHLFAQHLAVGEDHL